MASKYVRSLIDAGIHFGHRTSRWNPKMSPYIFGKRNLIHIIDIRETVKGLLRAKKFLSGVASKGQDVLFVGTKRQARNAVAQAAERTGMHYVAERWLGGTLTNYRTIRSRLSRLEELETIEAEGMADKYSKKMIATLTRERRKIHRNLEGIRRMNKLPGALVLIDVQREIIAAKEARKLGIPVIALIDTDSDPDFVDIPIPGNDDAMRAIELVLEELCESMLAGKRGRPAEDGTDEAGRGPRAARRSSRATARAGKKEAKTNPEPAASDDSDTATAENPPTGSPVAST
ncbi:MAG: 30S ribosomal protein S2 [Planctomycetota bacterium]|nr:MAG: 30S ribosomal protein S2 [Planctomycetota bacterium]